PSGSDSTGTDGTKASAKRRRVDRSFGERVSRGSDESPPGRPDRWAVLRPFAPSSSVPIYPRPGFGGAGDDRVRLRGAREERRPSKSAHPTEGTWRNLKPRPRTTRTGTAAPDGRASEVRGSSWGT